MAGGARSYIVRSGDVLSKIAQQSGVSTLELARVNGLTPPYQVRLGQRLVLPGSGAAGSLPPTPPTPLHPVGRMPPPPPALPPAAANGAPPHVLRLPSNYNPGATVRAPSSPPAVTQPVLPPAVPPGHAGKPATASASPASSSTASAKGEEVPSRSGARFMLPVNGPLLSGYGTKPDGRHNDGLNIGANRGTPVAAADDGVVAYVGNELRGYGNLILIRHSDGWMTAYAHLDHTMVSRGAEVRRGQKIGTVGTTGTVTTPQLHFEVRRGSQAVDPKNFVDTPHE